LKYYDASKIAISTIVDPYRAYIIWLMGAAMAVLVPVLFIIIFVISKRGIPEPTSKKIIKHANFNH